MKVAQLCPTLRDSMDCTVHGILQARTLEWIRCSFLQRIFPTQELNQVSCLAGGFFTDRAIKEARSQVDYKWNRAIFPFGAWFLLLSTMSSRLIFVASHYRIFFFLRLNNIPFCLYTTFSLPIIC